MVASHDVDFGHIARKAGPQRVQSRTWALAAPPLMKITSQSAWWEGEISQDSQDFTGLTGLFLYIVEGRFIIKAFLTPNQSCQSCEFCEILPFSEQVGEMI